VTDTVDYGVPTGSWEDAEELVGQEIGRWAGPDAAYEGDFRRRLEVLAWDCPLHYDERVAQQHGYRTVVAPATMYMIYAFPAYWEPGDDRQNDLSWRYMPKIPMVFKAPGHGDGMMDTDCEIEFHEPIYPGDRISAVSSVKSITRKRTRVGDGAFIVVETRYTKQTGELVAIDRLTMYRYEPEEDAR
jgi:3-methylfumaryl-CoA hydratase